MKSKTLHDVGRNMNRATSSGVIPHIFHRHGKLKQAANSIALPDGNTLPTKTESERMTAYGIVAAGDAMIPWEGETAAGPLLQYALRMAVSTRLMAETGGHPEPPAFPLSNTSPGSVFAHAAVAMSHYGTANEAAVLKKATTFIKKYGLPYQAKMLQSYIQTAVDMAMEHDHVGLEWLYAQFHSLYGTESRPNPDKPSLPPPKPPPPTMIDIPAMMFATGKGGAPDAGAGAAPWGLVESISKAPMSPWRHPHIRSRKSWKYSEFGVFKYPWRALPSSDYRCFSIRRRQYGGTLLIDMSVSMSIQQAEMEAVLNAAPYATIAGYGSSPHSLSRGRIVIVAEDSKKGNAEHARQHIGGGNIIDGPALRWLASQPGPRIWISDGHVTGIGDAQTQALVNESKAICRGAKIIRVPTLAALIEQIT